MPDTAGQLAKLLAESVDSAIARESTAFKTAAGPFERSVVIFGAGNLGQKTARGLRANGIEPLAFSDNNAERWNMLVDGVQVLSPTDAVGRFGDKAVFVIAIWGAGQKLRQAHFVEQLRALGALRIVPAGLLFWAYPDTFLPHYPLDLPHKVLEGEEDYHRAFELLADERSREEFVAQVRWRLHLDYAGLSEPSPYAQYFCDDLFKIPAGVRFIDGGAFDGDTIASFLEHGPKDFEEITAFEPDPLNFQKLNRFVATLPAEVRSRIRPRNQAIGEAPGTLPFAATGLASSAGGAGSINIDVIALDDVFANSRTDYIKLDIEGAELDALVGAEHIIARDHPLLAVCAYHLQDHLCKIPLMIHELCDEYKIFLRPHNLEAYDLICYAVPSDSRAAEGG